MAARDAVKQYLKENASRFEEELCQLLRIPSVSTDPQYKSEVERAAQWLAEHFRSLGLEAQVHPTPGHPIVVARGPEVPDAPTVLVYGHYDVQPPDPLELWDSPPFEPTRRNGNLYARGATDDKGQMFTHVKAAEAWLKTTGSLPVNLVFLIEGEEEVGSEHLEQFLREHTRELACDCVVVSDMCQFGPGQPAITYGLRGIAYYELLLEGPNRDLHSGTFGGAVTNPANVLVRLLASLVDEHGKVQVPGFYDQVRSITKEERQRLAMLPFSEEAFFQQLGVSGGSGERGFTTLERRWARPSFDINGLTAGYQGPGAKTVLPARASAKFSFRLVPDQDPEKITASLEEFLRGQLPPGVTMELKSYHGAKGVLVDENHPYVKAAAEAVSEAFGTAPLFIREGGSIPVVLTFQELFDVPVLLLGWGQNDDNTHSPNEKFSLSDFHLGTRASAYLLDEIARTGSV